MIGRPALVELYDYTSFTWEAYRRAIARLPEGALTRPVEGSGWPALRDALFHIAAAWDGWLCRQLGLEFPGETDIETVRTWEALQAVREQGRGWLRRIIDETPEEVLHGDARVEGAPPGMRMTVADVLTHILLHERGHHGDISTLLADLGTTPPSVDYLTYTYFRGRQGDRS